MTLQGGVILAHLVNPVLLEAFVCDFGLGIIDHVLDVVLKYW